MNIMDQGKGPILKKRPSISVEKGKGQKSVISRGKIGMDLSGLPDNPIM
jgi:hypothetical protein